MRIPVAARVSAVVWLALGAIGGTAAAQQGSVTGKVTDGANGQQPTRELGNSVPKIDADQLVKTAPTTNLSQVLNGRIAGVDVLQSNGTSGTGARIRIRGISSVSLSNDPLLYIDGIRVAADA